jgi:hypothetical protein
MSIQLCIQLVDKKTGQRSEPFIADSVQLCSRLAALPKKEQKRFYVLVVLDDVKPKKEGFSISRAPLMAVSNFINVATQLEINLMKTEGENNGQ